MSDFEKVVKIIDQISVLNSNDPKVSKAAFGIIKKVDDDWGNRPGAFIAAISTAIGQNKSGFMKAISTDVLKKAVENYPQLKKVGGIDSLLPDVMQDEVGAAVGTTTTTANVASYPIPIGSTLRPADRKKKKHEELIDWSSQFARSFENFAEAKIGNGYDLSIIYEALGKGRSVSSEVEKLWSQMRKSWVADKNSKETNDLFAKIRGIKDNDEQQELLRRFEKLQEYGH